MNSEHKEQVMFIKWFRSNYSDVLIFAVPNGGNRNPIEAKRLKDEGVVSGIPDLFVPEWSLWIEMKTEKGVLSKAQKEIIDYLRQIGHSVIVAYGAMDAAAKIKELKDGRI